MAAARRVAPPGDNRPRFGFYYILTRTGLTVPPSSTLLSPLLDAQLPANTGLEFDEQMDGWYFPNQPAPEPGRNGDLAIADRIPREGKPAGAVECRFQVTMSASDINEFIDSMDHETRLAGSITFESFEGQGPVTFRLDSEKSLFQYLRVNETSGEAEMRYRLEFRDRPGKPG